jgi:hypothetical protein
MAIGHSYLMRRLLIAHTIVGAGIEIVQHALDLAATPDALLDRIARLAADIVGR